MYSIPGRLLYLSVAAFTAIHALAPNCPAQGFSYYGQSARAFRETDQAVASLSAFQDMGKNVYAIDNLADQMTCRLRRELRFNNGNCPNAIALLEQMKLHANLTNQLIMAYRGKSGSSFVQAAHAVSDSIAQLRILREKARVSESVNNMISQSIPMASYVLSHASRFASDRESNI